MALRHLEVVKLSVAPQSDALGLPAPRAPELRPLASLRLYQHRWVWPPSFEGQHEWEVLREDIAAHGIRSPLQILRNGWVIGGTHRYLIARELGLEMVPVQVVPIPLARVGTDPLSPIDRLRIERTAVLEALGRRHLTRHQRDVLYVALAEAHESVFGSADAGAARRLANLRRKRSPAAEPPTGPTIDELARLYQVPARRLEKLLTLARRGDAEVREQFKAGAVSLERAYAATVDRDREAAQLDPVVRYVTRLMHVLTRMMDCWGACGLQERHQLLDEFVRWLDDFRDEVEEK